MSGTEYVILAYVIALGFTWGYAASLWIRYRNLTGRSGQAAATK
jgi:hypothetical protein